LNFIGFLFVFLITREPRKYPKNNENATIFVSFLLTGNGSRTKPTFRFSRSSAGSGWFGSGGLPTAFSTGSIKNYD